jgi:hypothetical protein
MLIEEIVKQATQAAQKMSPEEKAKVRQQLERCWPEPSRRITGQFRAHFESREAAEAFASHPANTAYHRDIAHLCLKCGAWHLSRPEWLVPSWMRDMTDQGWN